MNARDLNDELVAVGEAILAQMADEHGPDKADEKFHEWNDVVYDLCHAAFKRDDEESLDLSPNKDPLNFMRDAHAKDLIALERHVEELSHKAFQTWRDARRSGRLMAYRGVPINDPYAPLPAAHSTSYMQIAYNIPDFINDEEAKFLITAQVREALLERR